MPDPIVSPMRCLLRETLPALRAGSRVRRRSFVDPAFIRQVSDMRLGSVMSGRCTDRHSGRPPIQEPPLLHGGVFMPARNPVKLLSVRRQAEVRPTGTTPSLMWDGAPLPRWVPAYRVSSKASSSFPWRRLTVCS
jgi:hypothetical protein